MLLFWQHGYEATSVADLTAALGIKAPSLYGAFGDKKQIFRACVSRYMAVPEAPTKPPIDAPTARETVRAMLIASAHAFTQDGCPHGCLLGTAALSVSKEADDVRIHLAEIRATIEKRVRNRIARAVVDGEMNKNVDPDALAGFTMATIQGMSTLARDGASRKKLMSIIETAMNAWPLPKNASAKPRV